MADAIETLKVYFGYDSFRDGQENIINAILSRKDSMAIMPTGAGKSICYQVPALMLEGITLVISPLIALMQDQVKALNEAGIHAAYINSSLTDNQITKALWFAAQGVYKIIYVAPERLESREFIKFSLGADISMITVDESHCISQWGQDFRPSYVKIIDFVDKLPKRPVISAFTATATKEVKNDILAMLKLNDPNIVITGFDRENLYYNVETTKHKDDYVMDYIEKNPADSGIIYCSTRKNVDNIYELLFKKGVQVTKYHAGINNETRKKNQDDFIYDRTPVIVATNAFGMGIDKSNVRYVIHYNMPQSMENYYQEAGRAGRDGESAKCILLFAERDISINKFLLEQKDFSGINHDEIDEIRQRDNRRLQVMKNYCKTTECLRTYILNYFGENQKESCDNCGNCHKEYKETDMTEEAKKVISSITEMKEKYGQNIVIGTLLGANTARLREIRANEYQAFGTLKNYNKEELKMLISHMIIKEYLYETEEKYSVIRLGKEAESLYDQASKVIVRINDVEKPQKNAKIRSKKKGETVLTSQGAELFELLRQLRLDIAREESVPPYIVFNDKTLIDMCLKLPDSKDEMLNVSGVGEHKYNKYGERFIEEIEKHKKQ